MPQLTACPSCAEHLEPEDKFCGNCGAAVTAAAAVPPAPAARTGDYGLAPPAHPAAPVPPQPAHPPRPPQTGAAPPPGIADPREEMLVTEPDDEETQDIPETVVAPDGRCVACGDGVVEPDGYCGRCGHAQPRERDHVERELPALAAVSDRGLRHHRNEDAFAIAETTAPDGTGAVIAVVCDGVSSASRPDEASAAASEAGGAHLASALTDGEDPRRAMHQALLTAAAAVSALGDDHQTAAAPHHNAPACTCVSAVLTGDLLTVGWIGDSRAYWIPDDRTGDRPARLTEDDSWAARMVEAGLMEEAEAYADPRAHAITGWLGADAEELDPHTAAFRLERPGVVVVCTDGLWNYAESAEELAAVVPADARTDPLGSAQALVTVALRGGGHDNITVAVLPFPAPAAGEESV